MVGSGPTQAFGAGAVALGRGASLNGATDPTELALNSGACTFTLFGFAGAFALRTDVTFAASAPASVALNASDASLC